jgi:hypothetical protein
LNSLVHTQNAVTCKQIRRTGGKEFERKQGDADKEGKKKNIKRRILIKIRHIGKVIHKQGGSKKL